MTKKAKARLKADKLDWLLGVVGAVLLAAAVVGLAHGVARADDQPRAPRQPRSTALSLFDGICGYPIPLPQDAQCWVAQVTWREELGLSNGDDPAYKLRVTRLDSIGIAPMFHTRAELQAWVQAELVRGGFWAPDAQACDNASDPCVLVPPGVIERVELRQIIDHGRVI